MTAKPAVREPLVPQTAEQELLCLYPPAVFPAVLPAEQADTACYPAKLPAKQADTVHCPAVYSADIAGDSPAEHSVRTAGDSPAEHSADRKADKGCTEVLPQVRLRLL